MGCSKIIKMSAMREELVASGLNTEKAMALATFVSGKITEADEYSQALADSTGKFFEVLEEDEDGDKPPVDNSSSKKKGKVVKNKDGSYTDGETTSNKSQSEFIDKFVKFFNSSSTKAGSAFSLSGLGGTGKTTSVSLAIRAAGLDDSLVVYATHQNNAAGILAASVGKKAYTNFQVLQKTMIWKPQLNALVATRKMFVGRDGIERPTNTVLKTIRHMHHEGRGVLVIDESSMLDEPILKDLISEAEEHNFVVLFMGDHHQLPPVVTDGNKSLGSESPLYSNMKHLYGEHHHNLTEKVRTSQDSDIAKISDIIVNQIDDDNNVAPKIDGIDKGDGTVSYQPDIASGLEEFVAKYKEEPKDTRLLTANQSEHKTVKALLSSLREKIYGKENISFTDEDGITQNRFAIGEVLTVERAGENPEISSSESLVVLTEPQKHTDPVIAYSWYGNRRKQEAVLNTSWNVQRAVLAKHIHIAKDGGMSVNMIGNLNLDVNSVDITLPTKESSSEESEQEALFREFVKEYKELIAHKVEEGLEANDESLIERGLEIEKKYDGKFNDVNMLETVIYTAAGSDLSFLDIATDKSKVKIDYPDGVDDKAKKSMNKFFENNIVLSAYPSLVINAHKSQGATYKNVFVHMDNFQYNAKMSFNSNPKFRGLGLPILNKALYVAISRASKKLTLIGNAPIYGINNSNSTIPWRSFSYGFEVTPKAKPDMVKAKVKAKKASQYIGFGKAGSSTELYANQAYNQGVPVNSGVYSSSDVVFASVNGKPSKENLNSTLKYVMTALDKGAVVLLDSSTYLETSTFNEGERDLAKLLKDNGYIFKNAKSGNFAAWRKKDVAPAEPDATPFITDEVLLANIAKLAVVADPSKAEAKLVRAVGEGMGIEIGRVNPKVKLLVHAMAKIANSNNTVSYTIQYARVLTAMSTASRIFSLPRDSSLRAIDIAIPAEAEQILDKSTISILNEAKTISTESKAKIVKDDITLGSDDDLNFKGNFKSLELNSAEDFDSFLTGILENDDASNEYIEELDDGTFSPSDSYREHLLELKDILVDGMDRLYKNVNINVQKQLTKRANSHSRGAFSYNPLQAIDSNVSTMKLSFSGSSQVSSPSEITMHESIHTVIRGYLSKDRKIRNRISSIHKLFLEAIRTEGYDHTMFLDQIKDREPTAYEENTAKQKFARVFSETSSPEEFLAYALTNKALYELILDMDREYALELQEAIDERENEAREDKNEEDMQSLKPLRMAASLLRQLMTFISKKKKFELQSDNATEELLDVMSQIINNKEVILNNYSGSLVSRTISRTVDFFPKGIYATSAVFSIKVFSKIINFFNKSLGNIFRSKIVNKLKGYASRIYDLFFGSDPMKMMKTNMIISYMRKLMRTEGFVSLQHRFFKSQLLSENRELFNYAKKKNKIDAFVVSLKVQAEKIIKSMGKNTERASSAVLVVHKAGLADFALSNEYSEITEATVEMDKNFHKDELFAAVARKIKEPEQRKEVFDFLDEKIKALALYHSDRKVTPALLNLNLRAIGLKTDYGYARLRDDKRMLRLAKSYLDSLVVLNLDEERFNHLRMVSGSTQQKKFLKLLQSKERLQRKASSTIAPDVLDIDPQFNSGKTVRFGTKKQAKAYGSTMIDAGHIFELSDGTKIYRYATVNYSPSLRDTSFEQDLKGINGADINNIVSRMLSRKGKTPSHDKVKAEVALIEYNNPNLVLTHNHKKYILNDKAVSQALGYSENTPSDELVNRISALGRAKLVSNYNEKLIKKIERKALMRSEIPLWQVDDYVNLGDILTSHKHASKMYVKRDIALLLSGSSRASLVNANMFGWKMLGDNQGVKNVVGIIESILAEIGSKTKEVAVLLTPAVIAGNIGSNIFAAMSMGISPVSFAKKFIDRWKNFNEISDLIDRKNQVLINPDLNADEAKAELHRIESLLEDNQDYKLYKAGHISMSAESIDTDISHANSSVTKTLYGAISFLPKLLTEEEYKKRLNGHIEKIRLEGNSTSNASVRSKAKRALRKEGVVDMGGFSLLKNIVKEMIVADKSSIKDFANKLLIYSDSISKSIVLEHRIESGTAKSMEEEYALLDDVFVNYDYAQGSVEQFFESVGQFFFLKYYSSSMKSAVMKAYTHKQGNVLFYGTEEAAGVNIISPDDSFMKHTMYDALANRSQFDNLLENATLPIQAHFDDLFSLDGVYGSIFSTRMSL